MAAVNFAQELREELTCCICLDYFTDPVTTQCEHSFCRDCLTRSWRAQERNASQCPQCPQCREPASDRNLRPDPQLAKTVEISQEFSLQETKGAACQRHQEPLTLFCRDDKAPLCVECHKSEEHREHRVVLVEEAVEDCKEKVQSLLEKKIRTLMIHEAVEERKSQVYLKRLEEKKQEITSALEEMRSYLQEKEHSWMRQLAGLEEEVKRRLEENTTRLSKETSHFRNLIIDVEVYWQQTASEFLQYLGNTLNRSLKIKMPDMLELSPGLEWRLRSDTWKTSVLKKNIEVLEGSLTQALKKGSVTLDPDTAHPILVLSEDLKRARWGDSEQSLPDNPERFKVEPCVLGRERFTSGRHCWEVEVEKLGGNEMWALGVALESHRRKGMMYPCSEMGIWAVAKEPAWHGNFAPVPLRDEPKKIRVFLDYEGGCVEFFNADTDALIFAYHPAFCGKGVRPFFYVGANVSLNC